MKQLLTTLSLLLGIVLLSCGGKDMTTNIPVVATMQNSADSMSYVMGLNLGKNLLGMDSLLNIEMVCEGLRDAYNSQQRFNDEEARMAFLKYMNYDVYERAQRFEAQFLEDLRKEDRKFVATHSGLTYKIPELGNLKKSARNNRDTMLICYRILDVAGNVVDTTYYKRDTLRTSFGSMVRGLQEATRLIGEGGHIEAWIPSTLAFGAEGCDSLDVKPNKMLYYEMWLIKVEER